VLKYIQIIGNWSNKWLGSLNERHKADAEAKMTQIKVSLFLPPLGNNDNHQEEAEAVKTTLEAEYEIA
jgi:hypothetical protein